MSWQQSDTWQWWLQYGFDGIAGGLLGGAATGLVLWGTIRHERRMSEDRDLRDAVRRLQVVAMSVGMHPVADPLERHHRVLQLLAAMIEVEPLAQRLAPALKSDIARGRQFIFTDLGSADPNAMLLSRFTAALSATLSSWFADPKKFQKTAESTGDWLDGLRSA
ncbi:hypothetical protein [Nocardioides lianchengensis]|uniref:hypothetical protein n=1 Tax=Nocardioides lianchengensis TaxID=1045774 RepID=UPI001113F0FD|nr:hypothetical protein [Nocardioides lianchengensis]NYG12473.1 hypothetical protein [Nocardioides lianchengensis]